MTTPALHRTSYISHHGQVRFADVMRSELIKLFSLRSTMYLLGAMLSFGLGVSLLLALTAKQGGIPDTPVTAFSLEYISIGTVLFSQIIAGVLGVLCISAEYAAGTIQPTFAAVPGRVAVLFAKSLVLFSLTVVTALFSLIGSWALTYPIYAGLGIQTGLLEPGFLFALIGGAVYVGTCSVFGLGVGTLLRSAAGGSIVVFCMTLLAPILTSVLPTSEGIRVIRLSLLSRAGDAMVHLADPEFGFADTVQQYLSPAGGWISAFVWAVVTFAVAALVLRRRDA